MSQTRTQNQNEDQMMSMLSTRNVAILDTQAEPKRALLALRGSAELIRVVRKGDEKGVEKEREESERGVTGGQGSERFLVLKVDATHR